MADKIKIFDTTLRDGEQSPGCSMNLAEKIEVAKLLEKMGVDIIEAGFAISSPGDFESVKTVAETVHNCTVASLARATAGDIDAAWEAVRGAVSPRIHLFIATSPLHMEYKLKMTEDEVVEKTSEMVKYAAKYCPDIEFSAEDAMRSDKDFLVRVTEAAIAAGATTINLPDTVGYTTPPEIEAMISYVMANTKNSERAVFSVHNHNDLGMAVANSLAGVRGGARQIECTINGIGERAGNTSLEEVVMALRTRRDIYPCQPDIDTTKIYRASKTVYNIIGQTASPTKPIVGKNAFAHEAGIHQHGVLANKSTYEIMTPESVGIQSNNIVLGKHSGKHAFSVHLKELGYELTDEELARTFVAFKALCDKKKTVNDLDIEALVSNKHIETEGYALVRFDVHAGNHTTASSTVKLSRGKDSFEDVCLGDGPIDAAYRAIDKIVSPRPHTLETYNINSVSEGKDTLGEVVVRLRTENHTYTGRGLSTDIIEASILAYLGAINKLLRQEGVQSAEK